MASNPRKSRFRLLLLALALLTAIAALTLAFWPKQQPQETLPETASTQIEPSWNEAEGKIAFTIDLFDRPLEGRFTKWRVNLDHTPNEPFGRIGSIKVEIDTASLVLGDITKQALGPDFFDTAQYPKATFEATLREIVDGHIAEGVLTIKDRSKPVELQFIPEENGTALSAIGEIKLDRRDFGIGDNLPDERSLGFDVTVTFEISIDQTQLP